MQLIHYADGSILTGSKIARALVDYAQVLASRGESASVDIPIRESDGSVGHAQFLLGPASQMVAVDVETPFDEVEDDALVSEMVAETSRRRGSAVRADEQRGSLQSPLDGFADEFTPTD